MNESLGFEKVHWDRFEDWFVELMDFNYELDYEEEKLPKMK